MKTLNVHTNIRKLNGLMTLLVREKSFVLNHQQKQSELALESKTLTVRPGTWKMKLL